MNSEHIFHCILAGIGVLGLTLVLIRDRFRSLKLKLGDKEITLAAHPPAPLLPAPTGAKDITNNLPPVPHFFGRTEEL